MNKFQTIIFSTFFVILLCSFVIVEAASQQELNDFQEQLSRYRRFSLPTFPNEKRSDLDDPRFFSSAYGKRSSTFNDPRFFSSAYGKRSGGRAFGINNRQPIMVDGWYL